MSRVDKAVNRIVIVVDEVEVRTILRCEHRVLHGLVNSTETHQIDVVCSNLVHVEVFPLLRSEVFCRYVCHPRTECFEVACVGCLCVRITALERFTPTAIKICHAGKQSECVTVVQHLPALHLRIVEVRNTHKAENALRRFIVIEIVLSDEYQRVVLGNAVEH